MMTLPAQLDAYHIRGLALCQLTPAHKGQMVALQEQVMALLPDPAWYFPSEDWEFDQWLQNGEAIGYLDGDTLCGYAVMTPQSVRGDHSYAQVLGEAEENTFDFHDVMVSPDYRRRGLHANFLKLFTEMARAMGGKAIYATVDPENGASWRNFEREGYQCVTTRPAYDGRLRRYYKKEL